MKTHKTKLSEKDKKMIKEKWEMARNFKPTCGKCGWIRVSPTKTKLYIDRECKEHMKWMIEFTDTDDKEKYV